jgi:hypothetical protein
MDSLVRFLKWMLPFALKIAQTIGRAKARPIQISAVKTALGSIHIWIVAEVFGHSGLLAITCVLAFVLTTLLLEGAALGPALWCLCWTITVVIAGVTGRELVLEYKLQESMGQFLGAPIPAWACWVLVSLGLLVFDILANEYRKQSERTNLKLCSRVLKGGKPIWIEFEVRALSEIRIDITTAADWARFTASLHNTRRLLLEKMPLEGGIATTEVTLKPGRYFIRLKSLERPLEEVRVSLRITKFPVEETVGGQSEGGKQPCH